MAIPSWTATYIVEEETDDNPGIDKQIAMILSCLREHLLDKQSRSGSMLRERVLAITKIQEAEHWLIEVIANTPKRSTH